MAKVKKVGFYNVDDVQAFLDCKETYAYKVIRELNQELQDKGYLTMAGKVSAAYFNERFYGEPQDLLAQN